VRKLTLVLFAGFTIWGKFFLCVCDLGNSFDQLPTLLVPIGRQASVPTPNVRAKIKETFTCMPLKR
jgi:hypothetical protein